MKFAPNNTEYSVNTWRTNEGASGVGPDEKNLRDNFVVEDGAPELQDSTRGEEIVRIEDVRGEIA